MRLKKIKLEKDMTPEKNMQPERNIKLKKAMWIISIIPLIITMVILRNMPDSVPMHYDMSGKIDRWGSKYENLIFPVLILLFTLFWHMLVLYFEKKARKTDVDKERAEAESNAVMLKIVAISMAVMFGVMQCFILYGAYIETKTNASHSAVDIGAVSCILSGVLFIVLGNFMPKAKLNSLVGFRVSWSMYNDTTWRKSNRFGAVALMAVGVLTIITALFADSTITVFLMLAYLLTVSAIMLVYAHKVYVEEKARE